jgi:hypothetical protein
MEDIFNRIESVDMRLFPGGIPARRRHRQHASFFRYRHLQLVIIQADTRFALAGLLAAGTIGARAGKNDRRKEPSHECKQYEQNKKPARVFHTLIIPHSDGKST